MGTPSRAYRTRGSRRGPEALQRGAGGAHTCNDVRPTALGPVIQTPALTSRVTLGPFPNSSQTSVSFVKGRGWPHLRGRLRESPHQGVWNSGSYKAPGDCPLFSSPLLTAPMREVTWVTSTESFWSARCHRDAYGQCRAPACGNVFLDELKATHLGQIQVNVNAVYPCHNFRE